MIKQHIIVSCDAEGCETTLHKVVPLAVGGHLLTPHSPWMVCNPDAKEEWYWYADKQYCPRHKVTIDIKVEEA